MNNIQRYTQTGLFRRLEKHDGGELVYYHQHDDEIRKHLEKEVFLNEEYEKLSYKYNDLLLENKKVIKDYQDVMVKLAINSKRHGILFVISFIINIGLMVKILL